MEELTIDSIIPQRYESAEVASIEQYADDPAVVFEQKADGYRALVSVTAGKARLLTHGGRPLISSAAAIAWKNGPAAAIAAAGLDGWALDGELLATGVLVLFDCPWGANGAVTPTTPFARRRELLAMLYHRMVENEVRGWGTDIVLIEQAVTPAEKRALWAAVIEEGVEGVCVKRLDGRYLLHPRRRTTAVIKVKVTHTVDVIIVGRNEGGSESATLAVHHPEHRDADELGRLVVGRCSMIGKPDAQVGDVVEVRYLYVPLDADGTPGRLYQPTLLRIRDDRTPESCEYGQLVFASKAIVTGAPTAPEEISELAIATDARGATVSDMEATASPTQKDIDMTTIKTAKLTAAQLAKALEAGFECPSTRSVIVSDAPLAALAKLVKDGDKVAEVTLGKISEGLAAEGPAALEPDEVTEAEVTDGPTIATDEGVVIAQTRKVELATVTPIASAPSAVTAAAGLPTVEGAEVVAIEVPEGLTVTEARPIVFRPSYGRTARFASIEAACAWITKAFGGADEQLLWAEVIDPVANIGFKVSKAS